MAIRTAGSTAFEAFLAKNEKTRHTLAQKHLTFWPIME